MNFSMGHNKFSDWFPEEMAKLRGAKELDENNIDCKPPWVPTEEALPMDIPDAVDWVKAGKSTPIKDQGTCGSCWAFATTSSVESASAIFGSLGLVALSEQ